MSYIYKKIPRDAIVKLSNPRSGDNQGQETFLVPFPDKQTRNYGTKCSNQHQSQSPCGIETE